MLLCGYDIWPRSCMFFVSVWRFGIYVTENLSFVSASSSLSLLSLPLTVSLLKLCFLFFLSDTLLFTFFFTPLHLLVWHFLPQLSGSACQPLHITVTPQPLLSVLVLLLSYLSGLYWEDNTSRCFPYSLLSQFTSVCHTKHWNSQDQCKVAEIAKNFFFSLKSLSRFGSDAVCVLWALWS